jgi:hypothetical protein
VGWEEQKNASMRAETQLHPGSPADPLGPVALRPRIASGLPLSKVRLVIMGCKLSTVNDLQMFAQASYQKTLLDFRATLGHEK